MMYLVGALGCNALFAQSYKFSVVRGRDVDWVSFSSFVFSALFLLLAQIRSFEAVVWPAIWLGAVYGLSSGISQLSFFRTLRYGQLSVSWTIIQLSMLMPVLASVLLWRERPTLWQTAAIGGVVLAVILMGDVELRHVRQPLAWVSWLSLAYVTSGLCLIIMKMLQSRGTARSEEIFLLIAYSVSVVVGLPLVRGHQLGTSKVAIGAVRGLSILLANFFLLKAIGLLPGYLVFAAYGASGLVINVLAALLIWGE